MALRLCRSFLLLGAGILLLCFVPAPLQVGAFSIAPTDSRRHAIKGRAAESDNTDVYKNRAELTQTVLKEKVQEVKLLKGKVSILQDVVKKLQSDSKPRGWRRRQSNEQQEEKQLAKLQSLQTELTATKDMLEEQAKEHSKLVKDLEASLKSQKIDSDTKLAKQSNDKDRLEKQTRALQKEVLDMDQTLETTQSELQKLQQRLVAREDDIRTLESKKERTQKSLQQRLDALEEERKGAQEDAIRAEALRLESIEIATASVKAAEAREEELLAQIEDLTAQISLQERKALGADMKQNNNASLQKKIDQFEEAMEQTLASNVSNRKLDQDRFDVRLQTERRKHEEEIQRLRSRLARREQSTAEPRRRFGLWKRLRRRRGSSESATSSTDTNSEAD